MSGFDVHPDEMPEFPPLDDAELEAWLTGRNGAADEIEPLALFAEDLGTAMSGPAPSPKSDLALLLAEGFSPETHDRPPARRTKKMLVPEFLTGLAAKLAGMGLAAKLGLGVGVAAASVGGAGAAGVLPGPVQDVIATAVSAVTPFELPGDGTTDIADDLDEISDEIGDDIGDDTGDDIGDDTGDDTNTNNDFGKAVSADARGESDGVKGVDGQVISELARNKNNDKGNGGGGGGETVGTGTGAIGADSKATGLDRANQTPAAGNIPTSLPPQGAPGSSAGSNGLDKAKDTPAGDRVPSSVGRP